MEEYVPTIVMPKDQAEGLSAGSAGSTTGMAGLGRRGVEWWVDNAHHVKRAPGSYEFWHFEAMDHAGSGVAVTLFEGLPFHPKYIAEQAHWARRSAGKALAVPPEAVLAEYYPAAYMGVYQGGKRVAQFLNLYPPGSFEGRGDLPEVRVGPNRITLRSDGSFGVVARGYPYEVRRGTPHARRDQVLSAALTFFPTFNGVQHVRPFRPASTNGAEHNWVLAAPHGQMSGRVQHMTQADQSLLIDMEIDAMGYHDHHYGHGPLGRGMKRCGWGHFIGPDFTVAWQRTLMRGRAPVRTDVILLFEKDRNPMVIEAPTIRSEHVRTTRWLVTYATGASLHGSDAKGNSAELLLDHGDLIERSPFHVRVATDATLTVPGKRKFSGRGVTTVIQLHRLRWPLLSDMVLKSILSVPQDDPMWHD